MSLPEATALPKPSSSSKALAGGAQDTSRRSSVTSSPASLRSIRSVETDGLMESNDTTESGPAIFDVDNLPPPAYSATAMPGTGPTMMRETDIEAVYRQGYGAAETLHPTHNPQPVMAEAPRARPVDLESEPLLVRRTPPKRPGRCEKCCAKCCACTCSLRCTIRWILMVCLFVIVPSFILARLLSGKSSHRGGHGGTVVYPDPFEDFQPQPECMSPVRFDNTTLVFHSLDKFTFKEVMHRGRPAKPKFRVSGRVSAQVAGFNQDAAIIAFISTGAEDDEILKWVDYSKSHSTLEIDTTHFGELSMESESSNPCVAVNVVLSIRPGLSLTNLQLRSINLDIDIHQGLNLTVRNSTILESTTGQIKGGEANSFESRSITITSSAGSIFGSWPLLDFLTIYTSGGKIDAKPIPKEASKERPLPAKLSAKSSSGDVNIRFPQTGYIPARNYTSVVHSSGGDVLGHFIHGTVTKMTTSAGDVVADLIPYAADDYNSTIFTYSSAGNVKLVVRSPYRDPGQPMRRLTSVHSTSAGKVKIRYPQEWEGTVTAQSTAGSISLKGKDLNVERQDTTSYMGWKGTGTGLAELFSSGGNVEFIAGEE